MPIWRAWRNAKAIALLAIAALAVGIGSATAIYTVANAIMLKPLPYRDGDRFVALFSTATNDPEHYGSITQQDAKTYAERLRAFDAFGWFREAGKNLVFAGEPRHIQGTAVTIPLARSLGVEPAMGRWFEDDSGVTISNSLWRQLGSDPEIIGKALTLDGRAYTVTGVMPPTFRLPVAGTASVGVQDLWIALDPNDTGGAFIGYARRKPDVSFRQAEEDARRVAAEIAAADPANHPAYTARLFDLRETVVQDIRPTLYVLFGAAGLLFLIACANAAGLLLARSIARERETAIRLALGAGQRELLALYLAEALPIALAGAVSGVLLSLALTHAIVSLASEYLPRAEEIAVDWRVLLFALAAALTASVLASLAPRWQAARTDPADALGEGVRASASMRSRRLSRALVIGEIALAFALIAAGSVLWTHLRDLMFTAPGFDPEGVQTFTLSIPGPVASDEYKRIELQSRLLEAFRAIPGVEDAAIMNRVPLDGCCMTATIYPESREVDIAESQRTSLMAVTPGYFRTMRVPLRAGRLLTEEDFRPRGALPIVIDEAAARRYWGTQDPVGQYGRFGTRTGDRFQVVGVVGDIKNDGLNSLTVPEVIIPISVLTVESLRVAVRSQRDAASLMTDIRGAVRQIDAEQPISDVASMTEIVERSMTLERAATFLVGFFGSTALLMAMLGIYGVVSYSVRQRRVEIGTRMALGATNSDVLALVVGGGLRMAGHGVIAGGVVAAAAAYYLARAFQIPDLGIAPFLASTAIVGIVAGAASFAPAWRASMLSPLVAIRDESESVWNAARRRVRKAIEHSADEGDAPEIAPLITEFASAVRSAATFQEALAAALEALRERASAESVVLLEKSGGVYRGGGYSLPAHGLLAGRLKNYGHPLALTDRDLDAWARWAQAFQPESSPEVETLRAMDARLAVALRTKTEIVGMLVLGPPKGRERYTRAEREALESPAEVFALMLENARLTERAIEQEKIRRDLALAAEVQRKLLPPQAPANGIAALAGFTLPARTVGGDYYDFIDAGDGKIGLAVADVSGKGIAAALLMSVVQASLRAIAGDGGVPLSDLAARMNRFLYQSTGSSKYATFFYVEIGGHTLRYVNAGHNPPYLVRRAGTDVEVFELAAGGPPLGLFPQAKFETAEIDLTPGDVVVAFTDGVPEALNEAGEEFGEERVKDALRDMGTATPEQICSQLSQTLRAWIGNAEQHDDLTLVIAVVN